MKPEDVPLEWIVLFQRAYREKRQSIYAPDVSDDPTCFRHALAAVAPMIAAKEREACAKVALAIAHLHEQSDPRHETGWAIHDAIRARGTND